MIFSSTSPCTICGARMILKKKSGRLLDEYHVKYENRAKHSGRQVKLTYMVIDNVEYEVIE